MNQNEAVHSRFLELMEKNPNKSAEEIMLKLKLEQVEGDYREFFESGDYEEGENALEDLSNLYNQVRTNGATIIEATELLDYKINNLRSIKGVKDSLRITKIIPLHLIDAWDNLNKKQRESTLWQAGINSKEYNYTIDVLCTRYDNSPKIWCGKYVVGQERTDKSWITKTIDGKHTASDEARFNRDLQVLRELRG